MDFDYKNILIFGYSRSGKAVENVLKDIGAKYKIFDDNIKINGGNFISKLNLKNIKKFDLIVLSPAVSIFDKRVRIAEMLRIKVISELEFGFWFTSANIIAITGTNGKTTTTMLTNEVLKLAGYKSGAYGNIGNPLSKAYKEDLDVIVCEVSSFQLEATDKFVSKIGVVLNISEDHINRHKNYKNYIECKMNLFKNCNNDDYVLLDNNTYEYVKKSNNIVGNIINYDNNFELIKENKIYKNGEKIVEINKKLLNFTYIENILAVLNIMEILKIPYELINKIPIEENNNHRMEVFHKFNGVTYINDSKATNPDATLKGLSLVKGQIILLIGGLNKKNKFKDFVNNLPDNIVQILVFGGSGKEIVRELKHTDKQYQQFKTLKQAIIYAIENATKGDTVLLSPACASFDEFSSYADRGDYFKNLVIERTGK